jgi:hypothetical protein
VDVTKTAPLGSQPARPSTASAPQTGSQSAPTVAAATDRANIRPLDVPAALQILIAEVRASFELTALSMESDANIPIDGPPQAARAVLQLFLQAVPEEAPSMPAWTAAVAQAEGSLQAGLDQGIAAIAAWRDVPTIVVDAGRETHALVFSALSDDAQNPAWLRPEWAGFAPLLERFWRRRRLARRRLTDPDYPQRNLDDDSR